MTAQERLRQAAELLPASVSVIVSREALIDALGSSIALPSPPPVGDLTVAELAEGFHRTPSTIRGWLETGRFPGSYRLNHRDWRVPLVGVEAFEEQQRRRRSQAEVDLSGWRKISEGTLNHTR